MTNTPSPSRWADLFDLAMSIVDQANGKGLGMEDWTFGGGTALMLQIGHRDSHDIDLFISDTQYLSYLNPETQGYDLQIAPNSYDTDGARALKIVFDGIGEIDFICCGSVTDQPTTTVDIRGRAVAQETPAEIVGKKIVFRGAALQPRDMFDIAATSIAVGEDALVASLRGLAPHAATALKVARAMHRDFARTIMGQLMWRPEYERLPGTAQDIACRVLDRVATEG